jgi:phosphoacetylglucosamine mutase
VDCSNNIGYESIRTFYDKYINKVLQLVFINKNDFKNLNKNCGAEFVHKEQKFPGNFDNYQHLFGASLDGDADRLIYFFNNNLLRNNINKNNINKDNINKDNII